MELVSFNHASVSSHQKPTLSLRFLDTHNFLNPQTRKLSLPKRIKPNIKSKILVSNRNYVVADDDFTLRKATEKFDEITKLKIPGLPNGSDENTESQISSSFWEYKPKLTVHYEKSGMENTNSPAVLFLPGFGVGTFHFEKQLKDLGRDYRVWTLDFLGQGLSLPGEDPAPVNRVNENEERNPIWGFGEEPQPWASDLVFSVDLWREQVQHFVEQVIGEPVYIVGNSLGGFVSLNFAACCPHLVKGITLLNATPFWGFLPNPVKSPKFSKFFPWPGTFPLPNLIKKLTEIVWEKISDPLSIERILRQVYVDPSTNVDKVFTRIIETTQHPAAPASFASIMFAPQAELSFHDTLLRCKVQGIPICLMYGREDPWVRPIWGLQVKRQVPDAPYYEITPAGHCPHDEVPEVINYLLRGWLKNLESDGSIELPFIDEPELARIGVSKELEYMREGLQKLVRVRLFGEKYWFRNQVGSLVKSHIDSLKLFLSR